MNLQEQVIQTIIWQKQVNLVAVSVIEMLAEKRLIESPIAQEDAQMIDIDGSLLTEIARKGPSIEAFGTLEFPPECLGIVMGWRPSPGVVGGFQSPRLR